ncbi:MAG: DUF1592 domain-containing protein [Saprospiraceae bacterium]|nr:DUF1592 domain-containing protein [Saprospiraceae bacterium]
MRRFALLILLGLGLQSLVAADYPPDQRHYWRVVQPIMRKHCNEACHNADDKKGGLNLEKYDFIRRIQADGELFTDLMQQIEDGSMPPQGRPRLTPMEKDTLFTYIKRYLNDALSKPDPGLIPPRRLSRREYQYAVEDLTGYSFPARAFFPKDPSGGEGFDNYAKTLYITPLLMERYLEAAEMIIQETACAVEEWEKIVPNSSKKVLRPFALWGKQLWGGEVAKTQARIAAAERVLYPFATRAYRRILLPAEEEQLINFFEEVYAQLPKDKHRFDNGIAEALKVVLVSPNFLIRQEGDRPTELPYLVNDFEMASRLSFFLWSSIPDDELLEAAYRQELQDSSLLKVQVQRMLKSPKVKRMAESFAAQWLDIDKLSDPSHSVDGDKFPTYTPDLEAFMKEEAVQYFYHTLTESQNLLELLNGNYTFLNRPLAEHYGIEGVEGLALRKVMLGSEKRGGILGMGSVLTASSLPTRTSPVLRGKWVLEKVLGTPAKAPPPDVPELEAAKNTHEEMTLRELLEVHREDPAGLGGHQEMDDLGFALENYDAIGRWRESYKPQLAQIDASGTLKTGESFDGPAQLKEVLKGKKHLFAKNLSQKFLGFALGRSINFKDYKTVQSLADTLLEENFNSTQFLESVVMSYPFRYKISDPVVVEDDF